MLTINLDDTLGQELDILARQSNRPLEQLLNEIIVDYVSHTTMPFVVMVLVHEGIWMAECDALGLVTEAGSYEELTARVWEIAPELAELNGLGADSLCLRFSHEQDRRSLTVQ